MKSVNMKVHEQVGLKALLAKVEEVNRPLREAQKAVEDYLVALLKDRGEDESLPWRLSQDLKSLTYDEPKLGPRPIDEGQ